MVSPGFAVLFYLMMQQQTQKTRFLNVGHTRKSQNPVQASGHDNISTFKYNILPQIKNKWDVQFAKTCEQAHVLPKMIGF